MFKPDSHFLVVDDSQTTLEFITESLQKLGFVNMTTALNANKAEEILKKNVDSEKPITIILSDLNMPGPSGIDFLKKIRGTDPFKELPFVLITAESEKVAVIGAAMHGVSSYIVKPFDLDTLTKGLLEAWKKHNS